VAARLAIYAADGGGKSFIEWPHRSMLPKHASAHYLALTITRLPLALCTFR
jgi:hypothetical protein